MNLTGNQRLETGNWKQEILERGLKFSVYSLRLKSGQTLIEVLIAFAVTVVIGVGLVTVGLATQKSAAGARNEAQATKLAQEYIEKIRVIRDGRGWKKLVELMGSTGNSADDPNEDEFIITVPSGDVTTWNLSRNWGANTPCLRGDINIFPDGILVLSDVMSGDKVTAGKVDYCVRLIIRRNPRDDPRMSVKAEVSWKEGNNVRTSRAETVISHWCNSTIDPNNPDPCPNN